MNKTEIKGYNFLIEMGYSDKDIFYQYHDSPDFITSDDYGYEIKRNRYGRIYFGRGQFEKLLKMNNVDILVFDDAEDLPISIFSAVDLAENKIIDEIKISIFNIPLKKGKRVVIYDNIYDMISRKRKEIQKMHGLNIQIRDIVNNIVKNNIDNFDMAFLFSSKD